MPRRHRKKNPPAPRQNVQITALSHEGRGVAKIDGKTVFVHGALAQETVDIQYINQRGSFDEAEVTAVIEASPQRTDPRCAVFGLCGGCSLQHQQSEAQTAFKQDMLLEQLEHSAKISPRQILPPLTGPVWGYRRRARLGVRYVKKKNAVLIGFRERRSGFLTEMSRCEVLHPSVGEHISALRECLGSLNAAARIAQIEVAVGEKQTALVLRNLDPLDEADRNALKDFAKGSGLHLYLQPGGVESVTPLFPDPPATLYYSLPEEDLEIHFQALDFTQVNAEINRQMVQRAMALLDVQKHEEVLELFCGLGNFTLPLARRGTHVTAVEGDSGLLERAAQNARRYGLENIRYVTANLAQTDLQGEWLQRAYPKVLLDPPRSGALEIIRQLSLEQTQRLIYISCNPATLARDSAELVFQKGFKLSMAGIMDMFPHTAHVESIAVFDR